MRRLTYLLGISFIVVPLAELYVLIQVGHLMGVLPAIGLLLLVSIAGAVLVRREGTRAWRSFRRALAEGRVPNREVADGACVLVGGALLLAPGFITDAIGFLLVLPPTRVVARRTLTGWLAGRLLRRAGVTGPAVRYRSRQGPTRRTAGPAEAAAPDRAVPDRRVDQPRIIEGERGDPLP